MKLYIPSLGDKIQLSSDWTFKLYHEPLNKTLGIIFNIFGHYGDSYKRYYREIKNNEYTDIVLDEDVKVDRWLNGKVLSVYKKTVEENKYVSHEMQDLRCYDTITIPKDSILQIDRIYIRKGYEDYDSISFILESMPNYNNTSKVPGAVRAFRGKGAKGLARFWAKLEDANNIEFEKL